MAGPITRVDAGVLAGLAAVDHLAVADVDSDVRDRPPGVIGARKENEVAGLGVRPRYRRTEVVKTLRVRAPKAGVNTVVQDIRHEAGAVEGIRPAGPKHIPFAEVLLRLLHHGGEARVVHRRAGVFGDDRASRRSGRDVAAAVVVGDGEIQGVQILAVLQHFIMQMRPGAAARAAHFCNDVAHFNALAPRDEKLAAMGVPGFNAVLALDEYHQPVAAVIPGEGHRAVMRGGDFGAGGHGDIHATVVVLISVDGMDAPAVDVRNIRQPVKIEGAARVLPVALDPREQAVPLGLFRVQPRCNHIREGLRGECDV